MTTWVVNFEKQTPSPGGCAATRIVSMTRIRTMGLLLALGSVAAGCASSNSATAPTTVTLEGATVDVVRIASPIQFASGRAKLDLSETPKLRDAQKFVASIIAPAQLTAGHASAELISGLYTDSQTTAQAVWVLVIDDIVIAPAGPGSPEHRDFVYVYDSASGKELLGWNQPHGSVTCALPAGQAPNRFGNDQGG